MPRRAWNGGIRRKRAAALCSTIAATARAWRPGFCLRRRFPHKCLTMNLFSGYGDAEDNAAILLRFPKAIAILEASWTTVHSGVPSGPILYGTKGTIVVDGSDILVYRDNGATAPSAVEKGDPLPAGRATIGEEFLHHLETGDPLHPTLAYPSTSRRWRFSTPP